MDGGLPALTSCFTSSNRSVRVGKAGAMGSSSAGAAVPWSFTTGVSPDCETRMASRHESLKATSVASAKQEAGLQVEGVAAVSVLANRGKRTDSHVLRKF